jgi:hypothetical protein
MPHMTGVALASGLWHIRTDTPIILCTGSPTMTWHKAQLLGFAFLLRKPFGLPDIAFAIGQNLPALPGPVS